MTFLLATNNQKKLAEMNRILLPLGIKVVSLNEADIDIEDVEETGETFKENAYIKASAAFHLSGMPTIADDSGLVVDALNGEPGVYSARYSGGHGNDAKNIEKLLDKMKDVPIEDRTARFVCSICCIFSKEDILFVEGKCDGTIAFSTRGTNGFGYDPVFMTSYGKSFAELSDEQKDKISHRGNALRSLADILKQRL